MMGSPSTGQRLEVMAFNIAMNSTSIFTPGCRSAGTCSVFELVHSHIPPSCSVASKPLQTQAGAPRVATGRPAARPNPAAEKECSQQPCDGAAWIHFPRFLFAGCFCLSSSTICICCFAVSSHKSLLSNSLGLWALARRSLPPDSCWDFSPVLQWVTAALSPPLFSFSLVSRDICETQKDKSPPVNCWASADTSCRATDRTKFIKIKLHNKKLRRLLN